ncbi:hypothetical protein CFIMG_008378RA00001 [Ceratocystis fimbriata CBS 114723]|uniref:Ribonucleases P/MRP subunit Pop8-like domain-containing protein n=1 Tax=Ceratocystis fimbriata CBS 114723 TaxID=1035309 RepID=A0A2C5XHF4_9PEZI|nr:hypothetical protein CFIMG_008378RA00001 [Ceratocystis fimbriata CBS 114723]
MANRKLDQKSQSGGSYHKAVPYRFPRMAAMEGVTFSATTPKPSKTIELQTCTSREPEYSYVHLELISTSPNASTAPLDALQVRSMLSTALSRFMGIMGNAVSPDVLKVEATEAWVRVPRQDLSMLTAALTAWSGARDGNVEFTLRAKEAGNWLGCMVGRQGQESLWS